MLLLFLAIGLAAGVLSGLFGIGGGLVIVPGLVYLAGLPILTATGTSLGALLLPVGLLGALEYYRAGHLELRASLLIALGLAAGVWFGARLAQMISPVLLTRGFAVLLVIAAVRMWIGTLK